MQHNGFDKLARPYRWMEYLSFGPLLWRTRIAFLPEMKHARHALMLGDGDGRFSAALLRSNRNVRVCAVDASGAMLMRLQQRVEAQGDASRLTVLHADATDALPDGSFDLVCTHFFLDCLHDAQCAALARAVVERMTPGAIWAVSEFAVPATNARWFACVLVGALYRLFAALTGLRVQRLPDYATALGNAGFSCDATKTALGGILRAELWRDRNAVRPGSSQRI